MGSAAQPPRDVVEIRARIKQFLARPLDGADANTTIGRTRCGVYAFFDYDGEPIYVGKTVEGLSVRIGRHLTGQRSDAVAKYVLDPFEVLDIEVWPVPDAVQLSKADRKELIDRLEYTVYVKAEQDSMFGAVLNEGSITPTQPVELPQSYRGRIIPDDLIEDRRHPDVRIARRALTIANLARVVAEREVKPPIRRTLLTQCQRLEALAAARLDELTDP